MNTFLDAAPNSIQDRPYETEPGAPTISFVTSISSTLLPYFALSEARINAENTELVIFTSDYLITIDGNGLAPVWRELQLQNIREITPSTSDAPGGECQVTGITISPRNPQPRMA